MQILTRLFVKVVVVNYWLHHSISIRVDYTTNKYHSRSQNELKAKSLKQKLIYVLALKLAKY